MLAIYGKNLVTDPFKHYLIGSIHNLPDDKLKPSRIPSISRKNATGDRESNSQSTENSCVRNKISAMYAQVYVFSGSTMVKKTPNPIDVHVGSRIRLRRTMLGMSQEKLGDSLGITFQQVQKYEKGANRVGASRLQHIAEILNVPIPFFFEGSPGAMEDDGKQESAADFMNSKECVALAAAFAAIEDKRVRQSILGLVRSLSKEQSVLADVSDLTFASH
jgi:transcriptional regulator with XRE-family HTH domain